MRTRFFFLCSNISLASELKLMFRSLLCLSLSCVSFLYYVSMSSFLKDRSDCPYVCLCFSVSSVSFSQLCVLCFCLFLACECVERTNSTDNVSKWTSKGDQMANPSFFSIPRHIARIIAQIYRLHLCILAPDKRIYCLNLSIKEYIKTDI